MFDTLISFVAHGAYFSGPGAHLKGSWNKFDFALVVTGVLEFLPGLPSSAFNALRTLRILRPLRAITRFPQLRLLLFLIFSMLPQVCNVLTLVMLEFIFFGLLAVQLWQGLLRRRCFHIHIGSRYSDLSRVCTMTDSVFLGAFSCPQNYTCIVLDWRDEVENPFTGFDNLFEALVTIMQVMTLEGWAALVSDFKCCF
jgi:hypothetical protein